MPRKRYRTKRASYALTGDFSQALEAVREASGLTWADMARLLGTTGVNLWRWRNGVQPNAAHLLALQYLADGRGLGHLLPTAKHRSFS